MHSSKQIKQRKNELIEIKGFGGVNVTHKSSKCVYNMRERESVCARACACLSERAFVHIRKGRARVIIEPQLNTYPKDLTQKLWYGLSFGPVINQGGVHQSRYTQKPNCITISICIDIWYIIIFYAIYINK